MQTIFCSFNTKLKYCTLQKQIWKWFVVSKIWGGWGFLKRCLIRYWESLYIMGYHDIVIKSISAKSYVLLKCCITLIEFWSKQAIQVSFKPSELCRVWCVKVLTNFTHIIGVGSLAVMTSWQGDIFHATNALWGDSTGVPWILLIKSNVEIRCFFGVRVHKLISKQSSYRWFILHDANMTSQ